MSSLMCKLQEKSWSPLSNFCTVFDIHDVDDWQRNNIHDWHVMIFMPDDVRAAIKL